ncbi:MAG: hypothetical protein AVDCRST_MAG42-1828 [uncultured Chthoniobacterales bacterium]|uniref:Uncharacterized protein n=1 Tax=uncultured Chthoniobacterales bacterium TaxID=1836801 RepID=A0A6J4HZJ3_9BACT|nr:MAG: hypothetical protein AVDCRST_MAG42-1828 [uncultured Chthoniobacterales bacterium]
MRRSSGAFTLTFGKLVRERSILRRQLPGGVEDVPMFKEKPSMLVLSIYLILVGLVGVTGTSLGAAGLVLPILALVCGVMILLGR